MINDMFLRRFSSGSLVLSALISGYTQAALAAPSAQLKSRPNCNQIFELIRPGSIQPVFDHRYSYDISIRSPRDASDLHLTIQPHRHRGSPAILVNFIEHANRGLEGQTAWIAIRLFKDIFADNLMPQPSPFESGGRHFRSAVLRDITNSEVEKKIKAIMNILENDLLQPLEQPAKSLSSKSQLERIQGIRFILTNFLARAEVAREPEFFIRYLGKIHRDFLRTLDSQEAALLHYSIFDRQLTWEAKAEIEKRIDIWKEAGSSRYQSVDDLVQSLRDRFIKIAQGQRGFYQNYLDGLVRQNLNAPLTVARLRLHIDQLKFSLADNTKKRDELARDLPPEAFSNPRSPAGKPHRDLEREIRFDQYRLRRAERSLLWREPLLSPREKEAVIEISGEGNSNFHPYSFSVDHPTFWRRPKYKVAMNKISSSGQAARDSIQGTQFDGSIPVAAGIKTLDDPFQRSEWGSRLAEVSAADSVLPLEKSGMSEEIVSLLSSIGIRQVYEITNYSAKDYVDRFHVSRDTMMKLLDELNALGIHLHFDSSWDRIQKFRKERPEYYLHRHTPRVRWGEPATGTNDIDRQTRHERDGEWD